MSAHILVVDCVPANVKLLEARLSAEFFDVLTVSNGAEALKICQRNECDIILLDEITPDVDGFEVCRHLKADPATHLIPVVMVTALDSPADCGMRTMATSAAAATSSPAGLTGNALAFAIADGPGEALTGAAKSSAFDMVVQIFLNAKQRSAASPGDS